jgi:hypothetical protein
MALIPATPFWNPRCETSMNIKAILAANGRDVRLDLFLGIANWFIFLDHIPNNMVNWITVRNYGFSGAADIFIFISGYAAAIVYAKMMLERGFVVAATRILKRVWQLYVAYVVLFAIYTVTIGDVAARYAAPDIIYEFNVAGLVDHPIRTVGHGLLLQSRALNLDVLPLYIVLMATLPPALWMMLRRPDLTMAGSLALYLAARQFEWNVPSFPDGSWYFNPFCWQLLFMFGAWLALGGAAAFSSESLPLTRSGVGSRREYASNRESRAPFRFHRNGNGSGERRSIHKSRIPVYFGIAYLAFALVMTMAGRFPAFGKMFPTWLFDAFNPNDKTNLAPYRVLHFIVMAYLVTRFVPKDWRGLEWQIFKPIIRCGQQSLAAFCVGVFLSFAGHFALMTSSGSLLAQLFVSAAGVAIMTLVAYYISWSKQQDDPHRDPHHLASADAHS